jgi:hypothetical protein
MWSTWTEQPLLDLLPANLHNMLESTRPRNQMQEIPPVPRLGAGEKLRRRIGGAVERIPSSFL